MAVKRRRSGFPVPHPFVDGTWRCKRLIALSLSRFLRFNCFFLVYTQTEAVFIVSPFGFRVVGVFRGYPRMSPFGRIVPVRV
jgi:hypothetical protein